MKHIEVVAAVIIHDDKILCVQRNESKYDYISKKFEFPGGKVEAGETNENAIKREILEELHLEIQVKQHFLTVDHQYPDFKLTMHSFLCTCADPTLTLTEHISFKWLFSKDLLGLDWAGADVPIVEKLMSN